MRRICCVTLCLLLLPLSGQALEPLPPQEDLSFISRGDFLLLLWQAGGGLPYDVTAHPFTDLAGRDALAQAAGWAYELGLIRGVGGGRFDPERPLTRPECALLLRRWDALLGRDTWLPDGTASCNDNEGVAPWAGDSLYWACVTGRLPWHGGRLAPTEPVPTSQAHTLFL